MIGRFNCLFNLKSSFAEESSDSEVQRRNSFGIFQSLLESSLQNLNLKGFRAVDVQERKRVQENCSNKLINFEIYSLTQVMAA